MSELIVTPFFLDEEPALLGNCYHGIVDGNTLNTGVALRTYPNPLESARIDSQVWFTPVIDVRVPGHSFTPPTPTVTGETWLDYALVAGVRNAVYHKDALGYWLLSFGVGDTWRCEFSGTNQNLITHNASGGTTQCQVTMVPFGRFGESPVPQAITILSNTLAPCGQPPYTGNTDDFPDSGIYSGYQLLDISASGTSLLLSVGGFSVSNLAPRGIMRLDIARINSSTITATLSMLKSRSDMLVSFSETYTANQQGQTGTATGVSASYSYRTWTVSASHLLGAYFDASGTVQYLGYEVNNSETRNEDISSYDTPGPSSANLSTVVTTTGTALIKRLGDSATLRSASWTNGDTHSGTVSTSDGSNWYGNTNEAVSGTGTTMGGSTINGSASYSYLNAPWGGPPTAGLSTPAALVNAYPSYGVRPNLATSSGTTFPKDFNGNALMALGPRGILGHLHRPYHQIYTGETFMGTARAAGYASLPYYGTGSTSGIVASVHPVTGQIIHKIITVPAVGEPTQLDRSYGWV